MQRRFSRFEPDSEVCRLNAGAGRWQPVSSDLESLLRSCLVAYELSKGLVNAAVLSSMVAIGYDRPLSEGHGEIRLELAGPLRPLPEVLEVRRGRARLRKGSGIDLGGIAKGWMADRLCPLLGPNAVANLGGDLYAAGPGPEGDGWPVGLGAATVLLRDMGAATSGVLRRRWNGVHHLIDPRTGRPAESDLGEVSVVASSGFLAEVVAKTVLMLGREAGGVFAARHSFAWDRR